MNALLTLATYLAYQTPSQQPMFDSHLDIPVTEEEDEAFNAMDAETVVIKSIN